MKHLSEEKLIEHHYGEGDTGVERHLEVCGQCAEAYAALERDLAQVKVADPPGRNPLYGDQVWRSRSNSLPVYAKRARSLSRTRRMSSLPVFRKDRAADRKIEPAFSSG